jgi:hypothetical protein
LGPIPRPGGPPRGVQRAGRAGSSGPGRRGNRGDHQAPARLRAGRCAAQGRFFRGYSGHFAGVFREFPAGPSTLGNSRAVLSKPLKSNRFVNQTLHLPAKPAPQFAAVALEFPVSLWAIRDFCAPGTRAPTLGPYPRPGGTSPGHGRRRPRSRVLRLDAGSRMASAGHPVGACNTRACAREGSAGEGRRNPVPVLGPHTPDGGHAPGPGTRPGTRSAWDPALGVAMGQGCRDAGISW